ncbi:MAG: CPBP family intramembrane metalloprotease, partial [Desulfatitalea sp.]|nr:CPBP family intramembrane metalloprotease [Desulfatitalea sp.]
CLIVGCCWGRYVHLNFHGLQLGFQNPIPLYAIGANLILFLFLRRIYTHVYADPWTRERYRGAVLAGYFTLYPPIRIVFEMFRTERRVFYGLTHAQVAMGLFFIFGLILIGVVWHRYRQNRMAAITAPDPIAQEGRETLHRHFSLAGLLMILILANFLIHFLTREIRVWPWPIQPVQSLADAYARILFYLPMMVIPAGCLLWMRQSRIPIWPWFQWNRFSYTFFIALAMSLYYCIDLLVLKQMPLRGAAFWPPVLVLSLMNAVAEEIMYRLALYQLLRRAAYSKWTANIVQAIIYSLIHFMIAGALLGIFALIYGLILGLVVERSKSLTPAIIVHFIIDLGAIGMPVLRM